MVFETEDLEDILIGIVVYCKRRTWIELGEAFFFFFWILFEMQLRIFEFGVSYLKNYIIIL